MQFRIQQSQLDEIKRVAAASGQTVSAFARAALAAATMEAMQAQEKLHRMRYRHERRIRDQAEAARYQQPG